MKAFAHHFGFEFRTGIRNPMLMFLNYLFPIGLYLMMGSIMPELNPPFRDVVVPGMTTIAILAVTLLGMPEPLVKAREKGVFRSYKINGIPATSILLIPALTTILHLILVVLIITLTAPVLFDAPLPTNWLGYALALLGMAVACSGLAVLIGVVSPDERATVLLSQAVFLPCMLIGGVMIPFDALPEGAASVSKLLPATHVMNALNGLAMGETADFSPGGSIIVLLVGGLLAFALALYLFSWDRHNTTRRAHPLLAIGALAPYLVGVLLT